MDYASLPDDALIPAHKARRDWWGGVSEATEWRWARRFPDFPRPRKINGRKYYTAGELRAFNQSREVA